MSIPVTVPRLGWNMEEGTFVEWVAADGAAVKPGDVLFRLEGDKAVEEVESLDAGVLRYRATGPKPGDRVKVGDVIAELAGAGKAPPTQPPVVPDEPLGRGASPVGSSDAACTPTGLAPRPNDTPALPAVTPRARRLAARVGVDPTQLPGTGRTGRVRERDIPAPAPTGVEPLSPVRRATAARMVESLRAAAPVTLTSSIDATNLVNLRAQFKAAGAAVPTVTDLLLKLVAVAIGKHPALAARWTDAGLAPAERLDIGFAVDTPAGLLVPVVRDVPALGLAALAARTRELVERARRGALAAADLRGGCFTITNLGAFGVDAFTPIINPPESAVLGVGRIARRPVMDGDRVTGREQLTLSLTFDHRVVDGAPAARFLQALAGCIENPAPWLTA
ncbi:dihydrolipoamide acetyltransferase family protein [Urbifossiella limnaea]|uniref:Dihydrolipoamide acetyltransferase component of pyruvate dehydrogenase complex n=1 Tax=Urbifossiella limnaea TaxID=2528023 RepID=A0A517XM77_9BACT|nr:dihydrolipoamide acetyltransferase family protein [Urbifossiella limnaea]QDU18618.1 Dihydrolipoyllysine-residue succinyltransferase component of 2-oxoglutarate dehydrogenase complex [Urbifossiella limnaea]